MMAAGATLALTAGVVTARGLLFMVPPVRGYHRRYQAEILPIDPFRFARPALPGGPPVTLQTCAGHLPARAEQ